jgi:hypothetical protein
MLETWWGRALVASRWSRAAYGTLKCLCFCWLGLTLALAAAVSAGALAMFAVRWGEAIHWGGYALIALTVFFCVVRGLPVLWEGRRFLATESRLPATRGAAL